MERREYVTELRKLYGIAIEQKDISVALHLLQKLQITEGNEKEAKQPEEKPIVYSVGNVFIDDNGREWLLMSCKDRHVSLLNIASGFVFWSGEHLVEDRFKITHDELCRVMSPAEFTLKGNK